MMGKFPFDPLWNKGACTEPNEVGCLQGRVLLSNLFKLYSTWLCWRLDCI